MSILIGLGIGISSAITLSSLIRFSILGGKRLVRDIQRRKQKKKLKKKLEDSIDNINYHNFINIIYEIKTYDDKFSKNMYIKSKKQYGFREIHFESLRNFNRRFSDDFEEKETIMRDIIKNEIERSLSLLISQSRLDL